MDIIKSRLLDVFFHWLPIGGAVVLLSGLIYADVQHNYRDSFNDPQIQIAEDISADLSAGRPMGQLDQQTDIDKSLSVYIIIYDDKGAPITSSGFLDSKVPKPPQGVFDYTRKYGQDRITWEPKPGVRTAIVMNSFSGDSASGFVLVGRNMRELEKRTLDLAIKTGIGLLATLIITFGLDFVSDVWRRKNLVVSKTSEPVNSENPQN